MENKKFTKRAVVTSIIAVLMCCTLLVGGTFAWFTDTATTGINTIESGNLDIELYYKTQADMDAGNEWKPVSADESVFNQDALWEPGYTEVVYFKVANVGNLHLKYRMGVDIYNEKSSTNKYNAEFNLSDYIMAYRQDAESIDTITSFIKDRATAQNPFGGWAGMEVGTPLSVAVEGIFNGLEGNSASSLNAAAWLAPETDYYTALVLWMPEEVGNEANYLEHEDVEAPEIQLGVYVTATQYTYEEDSFGPDYDEDATYDDISFGLGYYGTDITVPAVRVEKGETTTVSDEALEKPVYNNGGEVIVDGGSINIGFTGVYNNGGNTELSNVEVNAGTAGDYAIISGNNSYTALNDTNVNAVGGGVGALEGSTVVIDGGAVAVNGTTTNPRYNVYAVGEGTKVIINDGTFSFASKTLKRSYIYAGAGATVEINGGTFGAASTRQAAILGDGNIVINGGTFGFDPTNWVAEGRTVTNNGSTWTVE